MIMSIVDLSSRLWILCTANSFSIFRMVPGSRLHLFSAFVYSLPSGRPFCTRQHSEGNSCFYSTTLLTFCRNLLSSISFSLLLFTTQQFGGPLLRALHLEAPVLVGVRSLSAELVATVPFDFRSGRCAVIFGGCQIVGLLGSRSNALQPQQSSLKS